MGKKGYQHIVKRQATKLEMAATSLKTTLTNAGWLRNLSEAASEIKEKCKGDDWLVDILDINIT